MRYLTFIILIAGWVMVQAQPEKTYSLQEIIGLARAQSPFALQAETKKENRYWQWRTFKSNYNPQLSVSGNLPDFNRTVIPIRQEDGTFKFRRVFNNLSALTLQLSQSIGATGGEVFALSRVLRFDDFGTDFVQYSTIPAIVGINQPLLKFNGLKWDKRIEPLRYEESIKAFSADLEDISREATGYFFDLLLAQVSFQIATNNLANNDTIFKIAQARYERGQISRNELLQLQLAVMNAQKDLAQAELDLETSGLSLKAYIGLAGAEEIELNVPQNIPEFTVSEEIAITQAVANREETLAFKRRKLEAARDVARARGDNGFQADLSVTVGLVTETTIFSELYNDPQDQQTVSLNFTVPILDWGRSKSRMQTALANQKLVNYTVAQDQANFEQQVLTQVKQFKTLRQQLAITTLSDEMAQERYLISKNRYLAGDLSITDLNIALAEKDQARRAYIASLRSFWVAYYNLRLLTLYDFERNIPLNTTE